MKLLIDNALSPTLADSLTRSGIDAVHVRAYGLARAPDEVIFDRAAAEGRAVVSADTDFGTLLALRRVTTPSVILFRRSAVRNPEGQAAFLIANLPRIEQELHRGCVVVFDGTRIRVRDLPID